MPQVMTKNDRRNLVILSKLPVAVFQQFEMALHGTRPAAQHIHIFKQLVIFLTNY